MHTPSQCFLHSRSLNFTSPSSPSSSSRQFISTSTPKQPHATPGLSPEPSRTCAIDIRNSHQRACMTLCRSTFNFLGAACRAGTNDSIALQKVSSSSAQSPTLRKQSEIYDGETKGRIPSCFAPVQLILFLVCSDRPTHSDTIRLGLLAVLASPAYDLEHARTQ
ncbi:hypothetical protein TgHK011_000425 [Trichoderma gracile]|nr:hypothetical protein TgHK011_000425 [Trichoderma gracile]